MNREQAKAIWPMVKAFGEGEKIEFNAFDNPPDSGWLPTANPDWSNDAIIFRIADPYAHLKKAEAEGKVIQSCTLERPPAWLDCLKPAALGLPPERYRIKPEPKTGEAKACTKVIPWTWETVPKDLVYRVGKLTMTRRAIFFNEDGIITAWLNNEEEGMPVPLLDFISYKELLMNDYTQLNNSPCGQLVEEVTND